MASSSFDWEGLSSFHPSGKYTVKATWTMQGDSELTFPQTVILNIAGDSSLACVGIAARKGNYSTFSVRGNQESADV